MKNKKAVVLLSGGLDSATTLYLAKNKGFACFCLIFDYHQRLRREIQSAKKIARKAGCQAKLLKINLPLHSSALLDKKIKVAPYQSHSAGKIPNTYVPARNIIFLSFALAYAEGIGAEAIFIGAHCQDFSGYPDCRPEFFRAFEKASILGTKSGVGHKQIKIFAPLVDKNKAQIIRIGSSLGVPFALTWSCYRGGKRPCGKCDSCHFRAKGFREAGIPDPAL